MLGASIRGDWGVLRIDRLEVSGGFLDGLRLDFAEGLNVLIGPRGAGKTSVLELVRFVLGIPATTSEAEKAAHNQARAILGDGTVSLFCSVQGRQLAYSRTGLDEAPHSPATPGPKLPLVISQNEIEAMGLDPRSRRQILDRLVEPESWADIDNEEGRGTVASLERRLERLRADREEYTDRSLQHDGLVERLAEAEAEQEAMATEAAKAQPLQDLIAKQSDALGQIRAAADAYKIAEEVLSEWRKRIAAAKLDRPIPKLRSAAVEAQVSALVEKAQDLLKETAARIKDAEKLVGSSRVETRTDQTELQTQLKGNADQLEGLQQGAGDIGRRISTLRQQLQERDGLLARIAELDAEIAEATAERDGALDEAEQRAEKRFRLRLNCATSVTSKFHGKIDVRVEKSGEYAGYESALAEALQGSNLQYRVLAAAIAKRVSPRELVAAVEANDPDSIATAAGISQERAVRLVAHLHQQPLVGILLAHLDDSVDFALLDGKDYKPTKDLSMGQRCTVVLPLLLAEERESVLLDQPEDHLDNAFIVETLVAAIRARADGGQVIVATHNANIPVLGDAAQVIVLGSDGRHGFVASASALDDSASVTAITTLMEGGRDAFARRASFYSEHGSE